MIAALIFSVACAEAWPLVTMRHSTETTCAPERIREIMAIDARHRGCWDEYWLAEGVLRKPADMAAHARQVGEFAPLCAAAGIELGFQQGTTLGHGFSEMGANGYPLPDDAFQVDADGRRTRFFLCPRSPAVLEMEERFTEIYVREGKLASWWLDDDLRFGFYKKRAAACFCPRCLADFNAAAGTHLTREELIAQLDAETDDEPLRAKWAEFKAESLALFAAAARRGAVRANPSIRLGYQAISSASIVSGEDYLPILRALSDGGKRPVGIRPGHGYYRELDASPRWEMPRKLLDVAREAERCRAAAGLDVRVVYEQENYPRLVVYKSPEAALKEAAMALAFGCDGASLYWYDERCPEPLEHYEDFARLAAAWRPYLARLQAVCRGTRLAGVATARDEKLMTGRANTVKAALANALPRRTDAALFAQQLGIPVTVAEGAAEAVLAADDLESAEVTSAQRTRLLDALDVRGPRPLCVRIDKLYPLLVAARVDGAGRTVAVTLLNLSIGRAQGVRMRVRRPAGSSATLLAPCAAERQLSVEKGGSDELVVALPDLGAWEFATVVFAPVSAAGAGVLPFAAGERRMVSTRPFQLRDSVGGGFEGAAKALKANGITDVFCCLTDGPFARFPSKVMFPDPELAEFGEPDPLTPMLKALHAEGIKLHAWMTLGRLVRVDGKAVAELERDGRVSIGMSGKPNKGKEAFLCREDPRNVEQYRAAAAELIARGVDGIYLDYIRYAHWSDCYCGRFKKLYEQHGGKNLADWPKGVDGNKGIDPAWVETRADVINGIVKTMRDEVRKHPGVELSAAVFDPPATTKVLLGQDWARWVKEGWVDFVCPMDYYDDAEDLRRELLEEMPIAASGKAKIYPTVAVSWSRGEYKAKALKEQIGLVRTYLPGGFKIFYWSADTVGRISSALSE